MWTNPKTGAVATIPRHDSQEVRTGTLKSILAALLG